MKRFLSYAWQLPQCFVGLVVKTVAGARKAEMHGRTVYLWKLDSAISLGEYVIVPENPSKQTVEHECGHQKQSMMLGWAYLVVIGLPSILWCSLKTMGLFKSRSYYWFYTEAWADRLGEVER